MIDLSAQRLAAQTAIKIQNQFEILTEELENKIIVLIDQNELFDQDSQETISGNGRRVLNIVESTRITIEEEENRLQEEMNQIILQEKERLE